jgi:hypothetical protein
MAKRKIIWSQIANVKFFQILEFYVIRNGNKTYSTKLYKKFKKELSQLKKYPEIGTLTNLDSIRGLIVDDYILFYEITDQFIIIHTVWDSRQNPNELLIK